MFNLSHLQYMYSSAKALHLSGPDTGRWLWSYYASRLPGGRDQIHQCQRITLRDEDGNNRSLLIRNNGFDWTVVDEIFTHRIYRTDLADVKRILDLGGNIGLASLSFAWKYPGAQICVVEPMPENLAVLRQNIDLNRAPVRVVAGAVGVKDGKAHIAVSHDPRQHSVNAGASAPGAAVDVDMLTVPSLMKLMGWDGIDVLKIDIEGAEREILGGQPAWLKNVRCIVGEGHYGVGYMIDACRRDLVPLGFEVEEVDRREGAAMVFVARRRG
jgi:FkbM family methyltransferase